ncbi:uncharacterized protein TNCT_26671 [Trichonephila clavata]|uniref:Uncharacterized protein n=1 Tax=Trichonephila clavata TaxID=2740835 RepID=A0A8X6KI38_TRICU|nr:uncharacterized protein TNCT_26671 [Trichonephila clavata]
MISAMPAVAVRRGRKRSKTFSRFNLPPSHHSSTSSLSGRNRSFTRRQGGQSISTISTQYGGNRAFRHRIRYDSELDRQRRRFLIYMGTLFLITGLLLVFIGVGAMVPTAQTVGLLLIGIGAVLCIIKVFCSEAHATDVPQKVIVEDVDVESNSGGNNEEADVATPLAKISEFTELPVSDSANNTAAATTSPTATQDGAESNSRQNSITPTSPPNSIPETQVLIGNDSSGRY